MNYTNERSLRDQLLSLSIDLDDKEKLSKVLEQRVEEEKRNISGVEEIFRNHYETLFEDEIIAFTQNNDDLLSKSKELMAAKSGLLEECKEMVESVKDNERNLSIELRNLNNEADRVIEIEKKRFKNGYEERLQKFLSLKALEHKEFTSKALEPEVHRLQMIHAKELSEVENQTQLEIKKLKDAKEQAYRDMAEQERKSSEERLTSIISTMEEAFNREMLTFKRNQNRKILQLQEELEEDLDKQRKSQMDRIHHQRESSHEETRQLQNAIQQRLVDLRNSHSQQRDRIQLEHDELITKLKQDATLHREKDSNLHESNGTTGAAAASISPQHDDEEIKESRKASIQARDRLLQNEIRKLETDFIRFEKSLRQQHEKEKEKVIESSGREEKETERRLKNHTDEMAQLVMEREESYQRLSQLREKETQITKNLNDLMREIQIYKDGIAAQKNRIKDKESIHRLKCREITLETGHLSRELKGEVDELMELLRKEDESMRKKLKEIEDNHQQQLNDLNIKVKDDIYQKDIEIESLRERIGEEDVTKTRLEKILKEYQEGKYLSLNGKGSSGSSGGGSPTHSKNTTNRLTSHSASSNVLRTEKNVKKSNRGSSGVSVSEGEVVHSASKSVTNGRSSGSSVASSSTASGIIFNTSTSNGRQWNSLTNVRPSLNFQKPN